jgi:hypothetical protein
LLPPHPGTHVRLLQLCWPVHVTSHAHAEWQSTSLQESWPLHVIAQSPAHLTWSHDFMPLHVSVHDAAIAQSTLRQPLLPHVIVQ